MAMVDMSDNANTFGTATEDLQNAYQGFAKQNYTMLDNLKLGYGGTKEEMQRLVKDAHAVNSAVDESSLSFDNIVLAIHTMQEQMNIAGTTSREAATTIEGSVNMMKAAWENWLTELGKDDADMGKLTGELVESVETAASNVIPRVATIVGARRCRSCRALSRPWAPYSARRSSTSSRRRSAARRRPCPGPWRHPLRRV